MQQARYAQRPHLNGNGSECVRIMLKRWELHYWEMNLDGSQTLDKLAHELSRAARVEVWHSRDDLEVSDRMRVQVQRIRREESLEQLIQSLPWFPVMVALRTDWVVASGVGEDGRKIQVVDANRKLQEIEPDEFCSAWNEAGNLAVKITRLEREVVSLLPWSDLVPQRELKPPPELEAIMDNYPELPGVEAAAQRYADLDPANCPIPVTENNLSLISKMLKAIQLDNTYYWDAIVRGGLAGYTVYIHELVREGWCFENIPPYDPGSLVVAGIIQRIEHPYSLIAEYRFTQMVITSRLWQTTMEHEDQHFTLRELVLANSLSANPEGDWTDIEEFDRVYGRSFLRPDDRVVRPGKVEAAKSWYLRNGFPNE
jgi:hypothetical protein